MKSTRVIVSIIVIVAVFVAAYAVGLIIRHARTSGQTPVAAPAEPLPKRTTQPTAEERAARKEARAQKLQQSREFTEEQKADFREEVQERIAGPAQKRPSDANVSPEESQQISKKWQSMSEEERRAFQQRMQARMRRSVPQDTPADANDSGAAEQK
jgi:hypothetical protein